MVIFAGVEEAGRGPVIGPMVMAIAVIDSKEEQRLREIGVKDSKQLSPKQRTALFNKLKEILLAFKFIVIPPSKIDETLNSESTNLNWLEADKAAELVQLIAKDKQIDELYIDCPSTNINSFVSYLKERLNIEFSRLIAEHKADQKYPIVSAASIIAKVIRDQEIEKLHEKYQIDFGSGYTSDERTIAFLQDWVKNHKEFPEFVRKSWKTAKRILRGRNQRKLGEF